MQGIIVFRSVAEAVLNGFEIYDRTSDGYVMRKRTDRGFALALVRLPATTKRNGSGV